MTNGYQQFFKKAREMADQEGPTQFKRKPQSSPNLNQRKIKFDFGADNSSSRRASSQQKKEKIRSTRAETRQDLMTELHSRLKNKPKKMKRKVPVRVLMTAVVGLLISGACLWKADMVEKYSKKVEFSLMGYAGAEERPAATEAKPAVDAAADKDAKDAKEAKVSAVPEVAKKEFSEEEISHFSKLNERKRELDAREEELNRLEQELAKQKVDLDKRLKDLESTRRQISSVLEEKVQGDDKKVDSLVQMYSNMKPQQAAKVFETMDEDLAIEILGRMKKKPAAEILNLVKAEKAQVLSEKFAGYKRP